MHPGLFAWRGFFSNLVTKKDLKIYTVDGDGKLNSKNIIPQSFVYRLKYLIEYEYEPYSSYFKSTTNGKNYIKVLVEIAFIISILFQIILPVYVFNFFIRKN